VKEAIQQARQENPGVGQNVRLTGQHPLQQQHRTQQDSGQQTAQQQQDQP
jgi:hypothetical protein